MNEHTTPQVARITLAAVDFAVRTAAPAALDAVGLTAQAQTLRDLPQVVGDNAADASAACCTAWAAACENSATITVQVGRHGVCAVVNAAQRAAHYLTLPDDGLDRAYHAAGYAARNVRLDGQFTARLKAVDAAGEWPIPEA